MILEPNTILVKLVLFYIPNNI